MLAQCSENEFDFQRAGKNVIRIEREAIGQLDQYINEDFTKICHLIYRCKGKVIIMGMGKSGHIGRKIAATFASTGTPSFFIHPGEANHGDLGMIESLDIVIAISNSGESKEITSLIASIKLRKIKLICITSDTSSTIALVADICLCVKVPREACPLGLSPTSSITAVLVVGDALALALLKARGFTTEDFSLSHPGGSLGQRFPERVGEIMHSGEDTPRVQDSVSLHQALLETSRKKLGLTVIVDKFMRIKGIFTDGDLRRALDAGVDIHNTMVSHVMTPGGVCIGPSTTLHAALALMQQKRITSLLVANGDYLVGVVHIHDIILRINIT